MGCGITTIKYLLFIFNLVFALCGLAILIAGAITYANIDEVNHALKDIQVQGSPVALIVVGSIVFVVAFYGCCGAIRESHCMTVTFAVFLIVILIIEIAIGVVAFVNRDGWDESVKKNVEEIFNGYGKNETMTAEVNNIQKALECCGVDGPDSWGSRDFLPDTCCPPETATSTCRANSPNVFKAGCEERIKELIKGIGLLLGALAIVVGLVEITGVVFALCLASSIKNRDRRGRV